VLGDYQPEYFAQIDEHLLWSPIEGAELLLLCPFSNLFETAVHYEIGDSAIGIG